MNMMKVMLIVIMIVLSCVHQGGAVDPVLVPLTDYVQQGAVCLDGSTPGYYFRPGVGDGIQDIIKYIF